MISGELELDRLDELADEEAIDEIVAVRGLGQWTAEMFLLFHLERPDVLSGGDLGIRKAIQIEYGLEEMPTPTRVLEIGEPWQPAPQPRLALPLGVAGRRPRRLSCEAHVASAQSPAPWPTMACAFASGSASPRSSLIAARLGGGRPGRPRRRQRPTSTSRSGTRRRAPRARPKRVAGLSVGQLSSAAAFFQADGNFTEHEFDVVADSLLQQGALNATGFVRRVPDSERARFERTHGYRIIERGPSGHLRRGRPPPGLLPAHLRRLQRRPAARRSATTSAPTRTARPYLRHARDSGKPAATPVIHLLLGGAGINVYRPVYRDGAPIATVGRAPRRPARLRRRRLPGPGPRRRRDRRGPRRRRRAAAVDRQAVVGPKRRLERPGRRRRSTIADRTWLLVVRDPNRPGRQPAAAARRRRHLAWPPCWAR